VKQIQKVNRVLFVRAWRFRRQGRGAIRATTRLVVKQNSKGLTVFLFG